MWASNRELILESVAELPGLPWALRVVVDEYGNDTGFAIVRGDIKPGERDAFEALAEDHRFVGVMSWWAFPLPHYSYDGERYVAVPGGDPAGFWERPEVAACEAWFHPVRNPAEFFPPDRPCFPIVNSDFVDTDAIWRTVNGSTRVPTLQKKWDVVVGYSSHWYNEIQKNWSLALACVDMLVHDLGLSVLLLDRLGVANVPRHPKVDVRTRLGKDECLRCVASARLALFPNHLDPSPKMITEALALDVPVLVNSEILGGWKYVAAETGRFFVSEDDIAIEAELCLSGCFQPRQWLSRRYGRDLAAKRFAKALRSLGGADDLGYALPTSLFIIRP